MPYTGTYICQHQKEKHFNIGNFVYVGAGKIFGMYGPVKWFHEKEITDMSLHCSQPEIVDCVNY